MGKRLHATVAFIRRSLAEDPEMARNIGDGTMSAAEILRELEGENGHALVPCGDPKCSDCNDSK